ncbi:MAG: hypothetical protein ACI8T1_004314 [Verrucomicrobiales bacterium]|jgi:hypothetical protein
MTARWVRSDLEIPDAVFQACSIYLLLAIGLKGGSALSQSSVQDIASPVGMALLLGVVTPFSAFFLLKWFAKLDRINAAATAAHYGSVSAVTFLASMEAAKIAGWQPEGYLPALVAILEVPGILIGLCLAKSGKSGHLKRAVHEVLTGKSMILLVGGLLIGWSSGAEKVETVAPFFITPFKGVLCLFLLELGMVAARRMEDLKNAGWRLIVLGCLLPLIHGSIAVIGGQFAGMSVGGAAVFGAVVGSASYIAAPAAVRISLPQASPGIYLTMALGVTFPINLAIGIPFFIALSQYIAA